MLLLSQELNFYSLPLSSFGQVLPSIPVIEKTKFKLLDRDYTSAICVGPNTVFNKVFRLSSFILKVDTDGRGEEIVL